MSSWIASTLSLFVGLVLCQLALRRNTGLWVLLAVIAGIAFAAASGQTTPYQELVK